MTLLLAVLLSAHVPGAEHAAPLRPATAQTVIHVPQHSGLEVWAVRFPRSARAYRVELREADSWRLMASGELIPLQGVLLPAEVSNQDIRVGATFAYDAPVRVGPAPELADEHNTDVIALSGFLGFFLAMALVNVISSIVLRSIPSAWYAGLVGVVTLNMAYSAGFGRGFYGGSALLEQTLHALLIAVYFACTVGFTFSLLGTWRADRRFAGLTLALLGVNIALVFCEDLLGSLWPLYALDQIMLDVLLLSLMTIGVRALRRGGAPFAGSYLLAFIGPLAGVPINDLATHLLLNSPWLNFTFELGIGWEATFFAYAVALRNRALTKERDWFNKLAHADPLTGVANRRTFDEVLFAQWKAFSQSGGQLGLVMLDIDYFKHLNDTQGHRAGDDVLRRVAKACAGIVSREGDCFARYGGEEFVAVLAGADVDGAAAVAERMRAAVERATPVTVSVGAASIVPRSDGDPGLLVAAADAALYRAKAGGRNCVRRA